MAPKSLDSIIALCKRRGFIFQSAEIYGGLQGVYDYGPLGAELKRNLKDSWWTSVVHARDDVEGLDSAILSHRLILRYSGHEATFTDPLRDCRSCKSRWRADQIADRCPRCGSQDLTEARPFNLMFRTQVGAVDDSGDVAYLRPETAQGIFVNYRNVANVTGRSLPFGIAQIGKAFRNEINPRNFVFRTREFEQMELEFFVTPGSDADWHEYWVQQRLAWWRAQGLSEARLRRHSQPQAELAHYAKATVDILYEFPHGFDEIEGIANRQDFDLASHSKVDGRPPSVARVMDNADSNTVLEHRSPGAEPAIPFVIEPSAGVDRGVLAILCESYHEEELANGSKRTVLRLAPHLAPFKAAVVPLARNQPSLVDTAKQIAENLRAHLHGRVAFEGSGNVGKSYRKHDEVGTPFCITVDHTTVGADGETEFLDTVTVRDRDSMAQVRIHREQLLAYLQSRLAQPR